MNRKHKIYQAPFLIALLSMLPLPLPANDVVNRLLDRIVENEQQFLDRLQQYTPILETYIQEVSEDAAGDPSLLRDHYMIGKFNLAQGVGHEGFFTSTGFQKSDTTVFYPVGFAQMVIPDAYDFDRQTYNFNYVRREFLGEVRTFVFDVAPKDPTLAGKFIGRIWVEDRDHHIVRFNGTYTMSKSTSLFFHFDSWRINVEPGVWMPAVVYVEDADYEAKESERRFRAQTRLWGYNPFQQSKLEELTEILIEAENAVHDNSDPQHVSPVESRRIWARQAEENIIERLEKSGLLAPRGEVDEVLDTVVNNLLVTNEVRLDVHCRVLLTTPLETFSVGQAIIASRGLLDVLPDEASLAAVLAGELAHLILGHQTETMWAFSDRTMFDDAELLEELDFSRSPEELEAASRKAVELLSKSPYFEDLSTAGLFFKSLRNFAVDVPNLIRPNLGNPLAQDGELVRFGELADQAPELDPGKLEQLTALPLGSRIKLDPWTNRLTLIESKPMTLLTAKDKMPFQITPIVVHLTRSEPRRAAPPPAPVNPSQEPSAKSVQTATTVDPDAVEFAPPQQSEKGK